MHQFRVLTIFLIMNFDLVCIFLQKKEEICDSDTFFFPGEMAGLFTPWVGVGSLPAPEFNENLKEYQGDKGFGRNE